MTTTVVREGRSGNAVHAQGDEASVLVGCENADPRRGTGAPGKLAQILSGAMIVGGLAVATPAKADISLPVSTDQPFTVRGYNPGYKESTIVYRFTPAGSPVGGPDDTVFTVTVPSHAVDEETFPAGTGIVTEEPQTDPSTGKPYQDLILDAMTYDNSGIQSLEQITESQRANTEPLVGAYADELYLLTGDTGGRVVLSQFTKDGTTNVQMTVALPANTDTPINLAAIFGGNKAPISVEPYDPGMEVAAVTKSACNDEYQRLTPVEVSPRVAAAVRESIPAEGVKKIFLTQQFSRIVMHDYFAPFIQNMLTYDASARALFQNDPDKAQAWATQRSDGIFVKKENPEIKAIKIKYNKNRIDFISRNHGAIKDCSTGALNLSGSGPNAKESSYCNLADFLNDPVKYFGVALQNNLALTNNLVNMGGAYSVKVKK